MPPIILITALICAVVGTFIMARGARHNDRFPRWLRPLVGAVSGGLGAFLLVAPINFCTFEAERDAIDQGFGVLLMGIGALAAVGIASAVFGLLRTGQRTQGGQDGHFKGWIIPILCLAPTLTILALFLYYPSIDTFRISTLLARVGTNRTAFVCVRNFTELVRDNDYLLVVLQTIGLSIAIVVISLTLSLLIATLAFQPIRGARIYRTLLIWPYAISPVVAGIIFVLIFNPAGGIMNWFLQGTIGISIGWLNDPNAGRAAVIIASVWKSLGFNILFYIAGLQNVPGDLKEAAAIDGANVVQRFRFIVVPLLSPITFFLVITTMTYAFFESFGTIDALTGGGPLNATTTMMFQIYETGVTNSDSGKAAAQSILLFLMVIGFTLLQFRTNESRVTYGA